MLCKKCKEPIMFIRTAAGKAMPCDPFITYYKQVDGGKDRIVTPNGQTLSCIILPDSTDADGYGYVPHWATCRHADSFRRKK